MLFTRGAFAVVLVVWAVVLSGDARAIITTGSSDASLRVPAAMVPPAMRTTDFSVFAWVCATTIEPAPRSVFRVPGVFDLRVLGPSLVRATVHSAGAAPTSLNADASVALVPGEWALLVASWRRSTGTLELHVYQASKASWFGSAASPAFAGADLGPVAGDIAVGAEAGVIPGLVGAYGPIVVRTHAVTAQDAQGVFASRRFWSAYDAHTLATGGLMNGDAGVAWMVNHAMTTKPWGFTGSVNDRAAVVGKGVTTFNYHVYDRAAAFLPTSLRVARPITSAAGFVYASHHDGAYAGFFVRDLPELGTSVDPVPAIARKARQLITGPRETIRVMTSANSRAIGWHDYSGDFPGNYASGFIERNRARVSGVLLRPAILSSGGGPWFGFDTRLGSPRQSDPGTIIALSAAEPASDFSRFWTGSEVGTSRGPGCGLLLRPEAFYSLRCKPEPGSRVVIDQPLVIEAMVLRFPGSSAVTWRPDKAGAQNHWGNLGPPATIDLDTTVFTRTLTSADSGFSTLQVILAGDLTGQITPGMGCFISGGAGAGSFSVVTQVALFAGGTRVSFQHSLFSPPAVGSTLRFGPWFFERVSYEWPALEPTDPELFRGIELTAGLAGGGVVVFAYNAWRPNTPGFVFGTAGWGGNGYAAQINLSFPGSNAAWMAATQADVWIQAPAQQWSEPSTMADYTALIRAGLPGAEIVWAGEMVHGGGTLLTGEDPWGEYILANASAHHAVGLASTDHPLLGTYPEQLADGLRADPEHFCQRGNQRQADVWTQMLKRGAIDPCLRADLNFDGFNTVADFGTFQTLYVLGDPLADLNGDGVLSVADFGAFQSAYVLGC
ncbi:MAG: GC-type dockerin domain-anchored protein [Phycisphaerales bacterium]